MKFNMREYGAYHIANNKVEYNPQRKNNFMLVVTGLGDLPRVGSDLDTTNPEDIIENGQEEIILSLKSCDTPNISLNKLEVNRQNSTIKFAGKPSFNDLNLEVYDYIGSNIKDTLLAWQNLSYNSKFDFMGGARKYKKDCQLLQLTPDGELVRYWEIQGAWLSGVNPGGFSMDDDGAQTISATLVYDWAELHMPDDYNI